MQDRVSVYVQVLKSLAPAADARAIPHYDEESLAVDNIQGHVLAGFGKRLQALLYLKITDPKEFKNSLGEILPRITTAAEVLASKRFFEVTRQWAAMPKPSANIPIEDTWINVGFSFMALKKLSEDAVLFKDEAFKKGMSRRSEQLGDSSSSDWKVGGERNEADVLVIFAWERSDQDDDQSRERRLREVREYFRGTKEIDHDFEATLNPGEHEHFGFRDGGSQPGLRGFVSRDPRVLLTPRENPVNLNHGKPGQDLVWPGEFVFGYRRQDPDAANITVPGKIANDYPPAWGRDGSFLVFRRLRQDVPRFLQFLRENADRGISDELLAAKLVGRWRSGAPILLAQKDDNSARAVAVRDALGEDALRNNDFEFRPRDPEGKICPFASHIRRAYPRDDWHNKEKAQPHRLLRRGIPYGLPY
jgi:deferrochelatase/peroxidase EfeB